MQKHFHPPSAASIVCFHALVLLGAGWFASYLPDNISRQALAATIVGPIVFFWAMYWLDRKFPVRQATEYGLSIAAAGSLAIFLLILGSVTSGASAVVSIGLIGSHTYGAGQAALVYATAVIFYVLVTYAFSVVIVTGFELIAHKLQKRVPVVQAYDDGNEVKVAAAKPQFLFDQSSFFLAQRAGMIVATCLLAVFLAAYLLAIIL